MLKRGGNMGKTYSPEDETQILATRAAFDDPDRWRRLKIAETKNEAQRRIYADVPHWKQHNLTARSVELMKKVQEGGVLTPEENAEFSAGLSVWDRVKAIRVASNLIEQDIAASADPKSFDVKRSPRWP